MQEFGLIAVFAKERVLNYLYLGCEAMSLLCVCYGICDLASKMSLCFHDLLRGFICFHGLIDLMHVILF
jgi:hypothetical protein